MASSDEVGRWKRNHPRVAAPITTAPTVTTQITVAAAPDNAARRDRRDGATA